jgi:hypothetical protein
VISTCLFSFGHSFVMFKKHYYSLYASFSSDIVGKGDNDKLVFKNQRLFNILNVTLQLFIIDLTTKIPWPSGHTSPHCTWIYRCAYRYVWGKLALSSRVNLLKTDHLFLKISGKWHYVWVALLWKEIRSFGFLTISGGGTITWEHCTFETPNKRDYRVNRF